MSNFVPHQEYFDLLTGKTKSHYHDQRAFTIQKLWQSVMARKMDITEFVHVVETFEYIAQLNFASAYGMLKQPEPEQAPTETVTAPVPAEPEDKK